MSDTDQQNQQNLPASPSAPPPAPTQSPAERLPQLVDMAFDVHESNMLGGKPEVRQRAAESVLDRAGYSKAQAEKSTQSGETIPAEALAQVIKGLAHVFGASNSKNEPYDVTESVHKAPKAAQSVIKEHTESSEAAPLLRQDGRSVRKGGRTNRKGGKATQQEVPPHEKTANSDGTEEHEKVKGGKKAASGLPASLLSQYGGDQ